MRIDAAIKAAIDKGTSQVQFLHECASGAQTVKGKKDAPAHTKVTFATTHFQPRDLVFPSQAQYVAAIVWIPREDYNAIIDSEVA